ncbi:MAG: maleylacetoacetate isomerase [Deltaproteobacteria bacterium]|nr:maleylacetoacetate isomerase [Deltaproteobacteria bacterium]
MTPYTLTLQGYWRSSASWRVRVALHLKGLDYRYEAVHLVRDGGEHLKDPYLQLNPMGQVPLLRVSGGDLPAGEERLLTQSVAIMDLLDHVAPSPLMFPREPWARARVLQLTEVINSGIQPLQNLSVLRRVGELGGDREAWAAEFIGRGLAALERLCAADASPFLAGDAPTAADACLAPQLYNARRYGLDVGRFPRLRAVEERCAALDAFERARPERQPDAAP